MIMANTILVVDDQGHIRRMVRDYLEAQGFKVITADNGRQALYAARQSKPDLILLDIMMPEMDGYEFIRTYRKEKDTPVMLLTARLEETDKVVGLELGADDYVTKPFGMRELVARIHAVMRRAGREAQADEPPLRVGGVVLDRTTHTVTVEGSPVGLTPSEFDLLGVMMAAPARVFSRGELLDRLQGTSDAGVERTIDVHVRNLRSKIEPDPSQPRYIETVFGVGYRFRPE